jgi:biopolymer transport protein ExbD
MMNKGGLQRKSKASSDIPSSSLADMAFLLLIFFMVSTVFRKNDPREWEPPEAQATQRLDTPRKDVLHIYLERDGRIFINDAIIPPEQVGAVIAPLYAESQQRMVMMLRSDRDVPYRFIDQVQKQLAEARAVRVTFYTNVEQRIVRERR